MTRLEAVNAAVLVKWHELALGFTRAFVAETCCAFSANDLWEAGLPVPANRRNLAAVLLRLEREGLIVRVGKTASVGGHGQPIRMWRAA